MLGVFRARARLTRRIAYALLIFIVLLLVFGATAFVKAPEITRADIHSSYDLDKHIEEISRSKNELQTVVNSELKRDAERLAQYTKKSNERDYTVRLILSAVSSTARQYGAQINWHNGIPDDGRPANLTVDEALLAENKLLPELKQLSGKLSGNQVVRLDFPTVVSNRFLDLNEQELDLLVSDLTKNPPPAIPAVLAPFLPRVPSSAEQRLGLLYKALSELDDERTQRAVGSLTGLENELDAQNADISTLLRSGFTKTSLPLIDIVQTNITRLGLIVMLTFLVSILTQLYRYNIRLAIFLRCTR